MRWRCFFGHDYKPVKGEDYGKCTRCGTKKSFYRAFRDYYGLWAE